MTTQYNIVSYGTLTNTDGVLSNFSASNYATIPLTFNPVQHPYEIVFKINTETMPTNANGIIWQTGDYLTARGRLDLEVWEDKLYAEYAANGESVWNITGVTTLSSNTDYWAKLTYNGINTYGLYLSTDGTTWTTEGTATSSGFLGDGTAEYNIIGVQPDEGGMIVPWFGSIDLNESYININGIRWWQGVTSTSTVQTRIQLRHDTAANWTSVNPVLLEGEVGIETDTLKQKVGDGSTAWNSLSYQNEIFIAEYNVTTYQEVLDAYNAGKTIVCVKTQNYPIFKEVYFLTRFDWQRSGDFIFSQSIDNETNTVTLDTNDAWTISSVNLVNKSGDTMTGALELNVPIPSGDNTTRPVVLKNTEMAVGTVPSSATFTTLQFTDTNDAELGRMTLRNTTTERELVLVNTGFNGSTTTLKIGMNTSNTPYCTFPNTTCVDGQWVYLNQKVINSATSLVGTTPLGPYTVNVPNDGHKYELLLETQIYSDNAIGNFCYIRVNSSEFGITLLQQVSDRTATSWGITSGTTVLGTNRQLTVSRSKVNNFKGYVNYLTVVAYRRIGTNS